MGFNSIAITIVFGVILLYAAVTYGPSLVRLLKKKNVSVPEIKRNSSNYEINPTVLKIAAFREPNDEKPYESACYLTTAKEIKDVMIDKLNSAISTFGS